MIQIGSCIQHQSGSRRMLDIPLTVCRKLVDDAADNNVMFIKLNELHQKAFDGSYIFWSAEYEDIIMIEISGMHSDEQIKKFVALVEAQADTS